MKLASILKSAIRQATHADRAEVLCLMVFDDDSPDTCVDLGHVRLGGECAGKGAR